MSWSYRLIGIIGIAFGLIVWIAISIPESVLGVLSRWTTAGAFPEVDNPTVTPAQIAAWSPPRAVGADVAGSTAPRMAIATRSPTCGSAGRLVIQSEIDDSSTVTSNEVGSTERVRAMSMRAPSYTRA